jgi:hypothetical protein
MQIMLDTNNSEDRNPVTLRALARFLETYAQTMTDAATPTPAPDVIVLKDDVPEFKPSDNMPDTAFERGEVILPVIPSPPTVLIPPPPGIAPPVELDSAGVAYDANLHSSTRSKTIDGKWKARRHRGANVTGVTSGGTTSVQGVKIPPGQETAAITAYAGPQAPPPIPPPPSTLAPPADDADVEVEADAPSALDFPTLINHVTQGMTTGAITQARIAEVLAEYKLDSLFALNTRPALVSPVAMALGVAA